MPSYMPIDLHTQIPPWPCTLIDVCVDMCVDLSVDMSTDVCVDMCLDVCIGLLFLYASYQV